jgi:hypothetical protein
MFEKLRKAIHRRKEKRNNDIDTISLMESDVAQEVIDYFEKRLRLDKTLTPQKIIKEIFDKAEKIDLIDRIKRHYGQGPFVILFLYLYMRGDSICGLMCCLQMLQMKY